MATMFTGGCAAVMTGDTGTRCHCRVIKPGRDPRAGGMAGITGFVSHHMAAVFTRSGKTVMTIGANAGRNHGVIKTGTCPGLAIMTLITITNCLHVIGWFFGGGTGTTQVVTTGTFSRRTFEHTTNMTINTFGTVMGTRKGKSRRQVIKIRTAHTTALLGWLLFFCGR